MSIGEWQAVMVIISAVSLIAGLWILSRESVASIEETRAEIRDENLTNIHRGLFR